MKKNNVLVILCLLFAFRLSAQDIAGIAKKFISTLSAEQQLNSLFPFDGAEQYNYHFVPLERKGITFNEMTPEQQVLAVQLMHSCISQTAFQKISEIRQMETYLKELEKRKPEDHFRDTGNYHISIFGIPAATTIWGWRFEGHHISYNFSVNKNKLVAGTPGFMGSNPAIVLTGATKGKEILKDETAVGFELLNALSKEQLAKAVFDTGAPKDILTFDKRKAWIDTPVGISYKELNPAQQQLLLRIVNVYTHRYTQLFAEDRLKDIQKAGLNNLRFAWAGATEKALGKGTYYRVQGPTIIIEYDNTQNNANHVHSVYRDLQHDFGGDELLAHYREAHGK